MGANQALFSIVVAISAQLQVFNALRLEDYPYNSWATILCQQFAQNLSVITACLPCLHPIIISILAGTTKLDTINIDYEAPPLIQQYWRKKTGNFYPIPSWASSTSRLPFLEKPEEPYCRPLATHGLDQSSPHLCAEAVPRIPINVAQPVFARAPPENIFNRLIEVPKSRPVTTSSTTNPFEAPKNWGEVGVLPMIDSDSDSNKSIASSKGSSSRKRTSEYVFQRSKVISVPEERHLYDDGVKQFAPPLPSPRWPRKPPRAF